MFVTHLESALDGTRLPAGQVHTVHQGRPLWVRYDLAAPFPVHAGMEASAKRRF